MPSYSYTNKRTTTDLFFGSLRFGPGETKTYDKTQPLLDNGVPDKLDRYVDGVQDNNPFDDTTALPIPLSTSLTLSASDDGKTYEATTALTITVPSGLVSRPQVLIIPPPSGVVTVSVSGIATTNGGVGSLTRNRTNNPSGFVIAPYISANAFSVSGS